MINKLFISTKDYRWDKSLGLTFVEHRSLDDIISRTNLIDCYTSPEDLSSHGVQSAISSAQKIYLVDIDLSTVDLNNDNIFCYGRLFNELTKHQSKISDYKEFQLADQLLNQRTTEDNVLWSVGCSVTAGMGVQENERWANLLATSLNMPHISLASPGSSIFWAADQIMRSNLKPGDIVVWGLTGIHRVEVSHEWKFKSVTIREYPTIPLDKQYWNIDYFDSQTQALQAVRIVKQVINFCQHAQVKLYIANIFDLTWFRVMFDNLENFVDLTDSLAVVDDKVKFIDLGTDNDHPGPKQHQQYADKLLTLIEENHHGKTI